MIRGMRVALVVLMMVSTGFALLPQAIGTHQEDLPIITELDGSDGTSWAIALKSNETRQHPWGNQVTIQLTWGRPWTSTAPAQGFMILDPEDPTGDPQKIIVGAHAGSTRDRLLISSGGDHGDPLDLDEGRIRLLGDGKDGIKVGYVIDPGQWGNLAFWIAGSETATVTIRGVGIEVREVLTGDAYALGNDELVAEGLRVRQGVEVPPGPGDGHMGAGATATNDQSYNFTAEHEMVGLWTAYTHKSACALIICVHSGGAQDDVISEIREGGFAEISYSGPGVRGIDQDLYWFRDDHPAGNYTFRIDHMMDASGPWFALGNDGAYLGENKVLLTFAQIDRSPLAEFGGP